MSSTKKTLSIVERRNAWYYRFGEDCGRTTCGVCLKRQITQMDHTTGHIHAEAKGGTSDPENLLPICDSCNRAMGTIDMRDFTRQIYKRDLVIPRFVEGTTVEHISPTADGRIAEFVRTNFTPGPSNKTNRKTFIDYVKTSILGIVDISVEEIYLEIGKQFGVSISTPSVEINGLAIRSILEAEESKSREAETALNREFLSFFNTCFVLEEGAGPIGFKYVRERFNEWKKSVPPCELRPHQLYERMQKKCGSSSTEKEFWGVKDARKSDESDVLLAGMP